MARTTGTIYSAEWARLRERARRELPPVCGRCGGGIDMSLSGRHPLGPQLDHRQARAMGGEHVPKTLDGLMLSHARCNGRHGQRVGQQRRARTQLPRPRVTVAEPMVGPPGMQRPWSEW